MILAILTDPNAEAPFPFACPAVSKGRGEAREDAGAGEIALLGVPVFLRVEDLLPGARRVAEGAFEIPSGDGFTRQRAEVPLEQEIHSEHVRPDELPLHDLRGRLERLRLTGFAFLELPRRVGLHAPRMDLLCDVDGHHQRPRALDDRRDAPRAAVVPVRPVDHPVEVEVLTVEGVGQLVRYEERPAGRSHVAEDAERAAARRVVAAGLLLAAGGKT